MANPFTSYSWHFVSVSGFLALCLVEALTKLILNLAMTIYCHDSCHWLVEHVNTLCRVVGVD
jgi:hypothetical protein